jgi:hypothetical protein
VIRRCLVKKREERYQTAHELAEALRAAAWSTSFESTARLQVAPDLPEPRDVPRAQPASDFEATVAFPAFSPAPASMPPPTPPAQPISVETPLPSLPSHGISSPAFSSTGPSVHTAQGWGATQPPARANRGLLVGVVCGGIAVVALAGGVSLALRSGVESVAAPPEPAAVEPATRAVEPLHAATPAQVEPVSLPSAPSASAEASSGVVANPRPATAPAPVAPRPKPVPSGKPRESMF